MTSQLQRFSKIYVFDINPGNDDITKEFIMGKLSRILKNISIYQYFVIVSSSSLKVLKKIIADAKINFGYIVSDNGARIYNISSKRVIYEKPINKLDCSQIVHCLSMLDMLTLISAPTTECIYSFDSMNKYIFDKMHYLDNSSVVSYSKIQQTIDEKKIYSILAFQKNRIEFEKKFNIFSNVAEDWKVSFKQNSESSFTIFNSDVSKYKAVFKLMELNRIKNFMDIHYYGINSIDNECFKKFKNHLVCISTSYEAKELGSSVYAVAPETIIKELNKTFKIVGKGTAVNRNVYRNPNSLVTNTDEKVFDISTLEEDSKED